LKNNRNLEFWGTLTLLLATLTSSIIIYIYWFTVTFFVGSYLFIHWIGLIATSFIAVSIPIHYILKHKRPQNSKLILKIHVLGNLVAFLIISLHFAQNVGRLSMALERLGSGFALYILLFLIVATGILERYQTSGTLPRYTKVIHKYAVIPLYLVILIHVLEEFNIL
jgi:hypothetical protein